jgi:hypothetical protein
MTERENLSLENPTRRYKTVTWGTTVTHPKSNLVMQDPEKINKAITMPRTKVSNANKIKDI